MWTRGIRGATTIIEDKPAEVVAATRELLESLWRENNFEPEDISSILFTVTSDIRSAFPAEVARQMGWELVPLLCFQEIEVEGSIPLCIRVLITINTDKRQDEIRHVYLREAMQLRPDLVKRNQN
ncbi:Chorismate mutase, AroH class [Syntrophomonas zehnderi OL-4]|uniref:chorismate mutase n=1 Tax=Syntrophomonas zehnderi OL-4 TaxID=690567 RepID=A0A0E4C9B5_9FIRM|nr:chorismate mutase [Syntrophomonas zehnderi]CFX93222.1 Chorismate mutase, AroH class [Syntrophomonas zehnderi OL-4]